MKVVGCDVWPSPKGNYTVLDLDSDRPRGWRGGVWVDGVPYEWVWDTLPGFRHVTIKGSHDLTGKEIVLR